jgi:hypothetical protein
MKSFLERMDRRSNIGSSARAVTPNNDARSNNIRTGAGATAWRHLHCRATSSKASFPRHFAPKQAAREKQIAPFIEFESELRIVPAAAIDQAGLIELTGIDSPVAATLEQNIVHVNQVMQFGKFLAVLQTKPADAGHTVVTAFVSLAVESDLFEKRKEFENVPVLRNMVPAQTVGNSSFNTGNSISSGLPNYVRNQIKAIAGILERG